VLNVDQKEQIRRAFFIEGKSIRQIARERHHDRRTVRAAIRDAGPSRYKLTHPRPRPVLGPYVAIIDEWLAGDQFSPPKQHHTSRRIYHRLVEEKGYTGGESTVRDYVRQHRARPRPVFIPLSYEPGEDAQVDFGEGRLCFSKIPFLTASPNQQQEALFEGHDKAFDFFGGVSHTVWYDRMSQAVKKALPGHKPEEQEAFIAFRSHYLFESRFCNPREAHEKGLVENLVGYARRNYMVPIPEVDSFQELNDLLRQRCLAEAVRRVAVHERCYRREQDVLDVFHYLPLLKQRPGAFDHAKPLKMWKRPAALDHYLARLRERLSHRAATLEFLRVMELCVDHSVDEVAIAVAQAMTLGSPNASTVSYLLRANRTPREPAAVLVSAPACPPVQNRDLNQYDCFIRR
jgi:transposase